MKENLTSTFELVRCKLTLFYEFWQMNEVISVKDILSKICVFSLCILLIFQQHCSKSDFKCQHI
uniref:Uncharacterized protein n=1 Tax=Rhizophora mucronata TaxID=61149 RepID=A0A2P2L0S0_RHIMU